jgi:hypothetical protein
MTILDHIKTIKNTCLRNEALKQLYKEDNIAVINFETDDFAIALNGAFIFADSDYTDDFYALRRIVNFEKYQSSTLYNIVILNPQPIDFSEITFREVPIYSPRLKRLCNVVFKLEYL